MYERYAKTGYTPEEIDRMIAEGSRTSSAATWLTPKTRYVNFAHTVLGNAGSARETLHGKRDVRRVLRDR